MMLLSFAGRSYTVAANSCSGSANSVVGHYEYNAFSMTEKARAPLTMENVAYSDFTKMLENDKVLITLTRGTFVRTRNCTVFTIHSLVAVPCKCLQNALEIITRQ